MDWKSPVIGTIRRPRHWRTAALHGPKDREEKLQGV